MDTLTDIIMAAVLVIFAISGFRRGFVRSLVDLIGGIVAVAAAVAYSQQFANWLQPFFSKSGSAWMQNRLFARAVAALILFALFEAIIQTIAYLLDHVFHLPVLRQINSLLGGVLGLCKGAVVVLLACAVLRISLPAKIPNNPGQSWQKIGFSRIYQAASVYNPVYMLFQSNLWNEVGRNEKQKQE
ncbi:MAG TPA: CvpA family protein [Caproicibacter sp.]|nr:CvpA family protein [Caproicibacter sp.]